MKRQQPEKKRRDLWRDIILFNSTNAIHWVALIEFYIGRLNLNIKICGCLTATSIFIWNFILIARHGAKPQSLAGWVYGVSSNALTLWAAFIRVNLGSPPKGKYMSSKLLTRNGGRVYVASDGSKVKVGMSSRNKCVGRFTELKKSDGFNIIDSYITDRRYDFRLVEKMAHEKLAKHRLHGEYFNISFEKGIEVVQSVMSELDSSGFSGFVG
nr:GIY-YIG nuclease family protein [Providencia rettgeri]